MPERLFSCSMPPQGTDWNYDKKTFRAPESFFPRGLNAPLIFYVFTRCTCFESNFCPPRFLNLINSPRLNCKDSPRTSSALALNYADPFIQSSHHPFTRSSGRPFILRLNLLIVNDSNVISTSERDGCEGWKKVVFPTIWKRFCEHLSGFFPSFWKCYVLTIGNAICNTRIPTGFASLRAGSFRLQGRLE